ncbi:Kynurenine formamidase [Friedmanniella luteola]|uniref:Kynurenine formamidase n=1 Tax=Friedmanniella luteola TaxID=546871 RepID=A0A1H1SXU3_9ACTN|nr:cyclase family protein [Friedmanniella luteola]SDS52780.1 Kynurenine formamidase [Friedmanniella luteola]
MCTDIPPQTTDPAGAAPAPGARITRRTALLGSAGVATTGLLGVSSAPLAAADARRSRPRRHDHLDLTHTLGEDFPAFTPGEEAVRRPGNTFAADGYYQQRWDIYEHTGTHVDAPAHFNPDGRYVSELTPQELLVPAVVVSIARRAATDPDTVVTVADLREHERRHGRIGDGSAVLMYSGWGSKVPDPDAYRGAGTDGALHFPGFGADACEWLIRRRRIRALGVDTLSIDPGNSTTFETHTILNGAERYGIENLANLHRLPACGARISVGVIPFKQGSGGPAKVLASW